MELTLNLGWAMLSAWMLFAWLRIAPPRSARDLRRQLVAFAVAIWILWPVISVTDDLAIAIQRTAVFDCSVYGLRKNRDICHLHPVVPTAATLPPPAFPGLSVAVSRATAPSPPPTPFVEHPSLASIQNRPPPAG